jgi:hypothetical protein
MFESNEHSIPAFPSEVELSVFIPAVTIVAELPEIVTGAAVVTLMPWKTIVTSLV